MYTVIIKIGFLHYVLYIHCASILLEATEAKNSIIHIRREPSKDVLSHPYRN